MGALSSMFNIANVTMGAYQNYQEAQTRRLEAELAADGMEAQADRKELEAAEALRVGELNVAEHQARGRVETAAMRVGYAASGVKVNSGSAVEAVADKAAWNEYERQKIEYEAGLNSWGLAYDAALLRNEAANTRARGVSSSSTMQALVSGGNNVLGLFK